MPQALEYVKWKYAQNLIGVKIGKYVSTNSEYGETDRTFVIPVVTYGKKAFDFENILVSNIAHENVHYHQDYFYDTTTRSTGQATVYDWSIFRAESSTSYNSASRHRGSRMGSNGIPSS
jgi:hypothetical protein